MNSSGSRGESQGSGMVPKCPSPQQVAHSPRAGRAERPLPALLHPWKVDGNIPWVCSSSSISAVQPSGIPGENSWGKGSKGPLERDPWLQAGRAGKMPLPWGDGPGRMGKNTWRGTPMDEGQGCPHATASEGQFLICSAPCSPEVIVRVLSGPQDRTNLPSVPRIPGQTPDLDPSGCTFPRPFISLQSEREQNPYNYHSIRWKKCHFTRTCSRMELKSILQLPALVAQECGDLACPAPAHGHGSGTAQPKPTPLQNQPSCPPRPSKRQEHQLPREHPGSIWDGPTF